jgi:dipeptide/tripeptide permease
MGWVIAIILELFFLRAIFNTIDNKTPETLRLLWLLTTLIVGYACFWMFFQSGNCF